MSVDEAGSQSIETVRSSVRSYGFELEQLAPNEWVFTVPPVWDGGTKLPVSAAFKSEAAALASFDAECDGLSERRQALQGAYRELTHAGYRFEKTANGIRVVTDAYDVGGEGNFPTETAGLNSVSEFIGREGFKLRGWKMYAAHHGFKVSRVEDGWAICVDAEVMGIPMVAEKAWCAPDRPQKLFAQYSRIDGLPLSKPFRSEQAALQAIEGLRFELARRRDQLNEACWLLLNKGFRVGHCDGGFAIVGRDYEDDVTYKTETAALDDARAFLQRREKRFFESRRAAAGLPAAEIDLSAADKGLIDALEAAVARAVAGIMAQTGVRAGAVVVLCASSPNVAWAVLDRWITSDKSGFTCGLLEALEAIDADDAGKLRKGLLLITDIAPAGRSPYGRARQSADLMSFWMRRELKRIFALRVEYGPTVIVIDGDADAARNLLGEKLFNGCECIH